MNDPLWFGLDHTFFVIVMIIAVIGFIVSALFGVGGAILLIPLLAQRMPAAHAVALAAPVMLFNNLMKTWVFRKDISWPATWRISLLALPCAFAGAAWSTTIDDRWILLGVAGLIVLSLVLERGLKKSVAVSGRALVFWGGVTGAVSGIRGAAGPPTALGLKGYGLSQQAFVATVSIFAVVLQLVKMPAYIAAGAFPMERLPLAALLSVLAALGVVVAPRLLKNMPARVFTVALDAIMLVSAVWILYDVVRRSL